MNAHVIPTHVTGKLGYLLPSQKRPCNYMHRPPAGVPWENCRYEQRDCRIHNARLLGASLALDSNGFALVRAASGVNDYENASLVRHVYYRELEALALHMTGGGHAAVFDHLYRRRDAQKLTASFGRDGEHGLPSAVGRVHNDYTEQSGRDRFARVLSRAPDSPFVILNFWRPVRHAAIDTPLAICDARSFPSRDWIAGDIIYPDRTGEIYLAQYSEAHRWYYYPAMETEEVLVFKTYDSRFDVPARMTPHCAFDDPTAPADAPARRSIEARCLVVLD